MGVAASFVMWPRCRKQTVVPLTHGGSTQNLALIGQAVLEKKMFEIVDGRATDDDDGRRRTDAGAWVYYKLTWWAFGSGELKKLVASPFVM